MEALLWNKPLGELQHIKAEIPECPPDGVLVQVKYAGICGTDLHIMQKIMFSGDEVILGHEISGIVSVVGRDVTSFSVGDRVAAYPTGWSCTLCDCCRRGKPLYCRTGGMRGAFGFYKNGGWAEYCILSAKLLQKIPDTLPLDVAVLCEPNLSILRGWNSLGPVSDGSKILVIGAGIIGLLMACLFHHRGHRDVMISEIAEHRIALAKGLDLGFRVLKPNELVNVLGGANAEDEGFDVIVDCSGSVAAIEGAFPLIKRGGTLCLLGICPEDSKVTLNASEIVLKELRIVGVINDPFTFHQSVSLINNMYPKYLDLQKLGVKKFAFRDYQKAFDELKLCKISKAVLEM